MFKHLIDLSSQTARYAKTTVSTAALLLSSAIACALPSGADSPASALPQYWIKVAIVHDQKTLATPTVLVTEGTEAGISVDAESETTVNGKSTERDDPPAFRLSIVPSAADAGMTQLQMKIYQGTPEQLIAEPVLRVLGNGSVQFGDAETGIYTLNLAVRLSDGKRDAPPAELATTAR